MSKQNFVHLHVHSDASVLDGMRPIEQTVLHAKEVGFGGFALTDHGTLANWPRYLHAMKDANLKPIFGVEAYMADGERADKKAKTHHITLIAANKDGYHNIISMTSEAHRTGFVRKPRIDWELLGEHSDGVICLSGCRAGLISRKLGEGDTKGAAIQYARLKEIFGDRLWMEIMFIGIKDDVTLQTVELGKRLRAQFVLTNDVHYPDESDRKYHDLLLAIGTKSKLNDSKAMRFQSHEFWMKDDQEMRTAWRRFNANVPSSIFEQAFEATSEIFEMVEDYEVTQKPRLPVPPILSGKTPERELRLLAEKGMVKRGYKGNKEAKNRLNEELDVITSMGFTNYFLILWELTSFCRKKGILYGPRGSGAGSFILFCLEVIDIDPIENGLSFARFLNKARKEYPDVDMDFETDRRHEVIEHLLNVYGEDKVAPIASFSTLQPRALVRDIGRSLDLPGHLINTLADEYDGMPGTPPYIELSNLNPLFDGAFHRFLGQQRHMSKHAGGVVISDRNLGEEMPVQRSGKEILAAWSEGGVKNLSSMGFVKFDLLGLSALSVIKATCKAAGIEVDLRAFPLIDKAVAEAFAAGFTTGIFQFESQGITKLLKDIHVTGIEDVVAANALYRPGALDAGTAWKYAEWKRKPRRIHPVVDKVLGSTYGVITYQEQVIALYSEMTGASPEDSDLVRRLILKKPEKGDPEWEAKIAEKRQEFISGARKNGLDKAIAGELWHEIMTHTRYSFNKSHAAAYGWLAWISMWLKIHYPKEFLSAILNNGANTRAVMKEAQRLGVAILPPHVNHSTVSFSAREAGIFIGLEAIKGIGGKAAESIVANAPYISVEDFMERVELRVVNTKVRAALYSLHSFDGLPDVSVDNLEIDEEATISSAFKAQANLLGFLIPGNMPSDMSKRLRGLTKVEGNTHTLAGYITSVRRKAIKTGEMAYCTITLASGEDKDVLFWPETLRKAGNRINEGRIVVIRTKHSVHQKYGHQWVAEDTKTIKEATAK